jgi:hypothetical protein
MMSKICGNTSINSQTWSKTVLCMDVVVEHLICSQESSLSWQAVDRHPCRILLPKIREYHSSLSHVLS